jgi:hypothetical protein
LNVRVSELSLPPPQKSSQSLCDRPPSPSRRQLEALAAGRLHWKLLRLSKKQLQVERTSEPDSELPVRSIQLELLMHLYRMGVWSLVLLAPPSEFVVRSMQPQLPEHWLPWVLKLRPPWHINLNLKVLNTL